MSYPVSAPRRRRGATMQDVADLLNVSKQTVSAVINNKPGITQETRDRVLAAIAQVNYRMDMTARSLRTGRTNTVALVVTDVASPILGMVATAVEERLYADRYSLVLYNTHDDLERERLAANSILQRSVDGVLFVAATDESSALETLQEAAIPVVVIDRVPQRYQGPAVVLDNYAAGTLAADHLAALGHRRVAHIAGPANVHIARERAQGFRDRLEELQIDPPHLERVSDWHLDSGYAAMLRILEQGDFSAVFCAGDMLAVGAMRAIVESGRRIPADISVLGLDDIDLAAYVSPTMTTISQSSAEMAERGVELLLALLAGQEPEEIERVVLKPRLIVRASTAAVASGRARGTP